MECNFKTYVAYCDGFSSSLGTYNLTIEDSSDRRIAFALGRGCVIDVGGDKD